MESVSAKRCTKCGQQKPASREYFYAAKNGLHAHCKECFKAGVYARRAADPEHAREIGRRCHAKNREKHNAASREAHHKRMADPVTAERERARCREKARRERSKNPDLVNDRMRRYRLRNPEICRARDLEAAKRAYRLDPGKFIARTARQRARRAQVPGEFNGYDLHAAFRRQGGKCFYCDTTVGGGKIPFEADHFIPISKGGTNDPANIVIACRTCNRSKHDKLPWEWKPERFARPGSYLQGL